MRRRRTKVRTENWAKVEEFPPHLALQSGEGKLSLEKTNRFLQEVVV
jgi:hypothetical protein